MEKPHVYIFSYLKNSILYKPEKSVIEEERPNGDRKFREYDFISLESSPVIWRENGESTNEKNKTNRLTKNEVWDILEKNGNDVNQYNFKELHKKAHFDYIAPYYFRNDINDYDDKYVMVGSKKIPKENISPESVYTFNKEGVNMMILFALRFPKKEGFILYADGKIEKF